MIFSLAITGPTASGKTAVSLGVAKALSGEIISCDSMQIYKGMDIGTAKATPEEQREVCHHLIDFLSPSESYSVEVYREAAISSAADICSRGKIPIFVGGTGLYIDAVIRGVSADAPKSDPEYRKRLLGAVTDERSTIALWERLRSVDPESAEKIHYNNVKRVIRALEIYDATGRPKSELDRESRQSSSDISVGMLTIDFHDRENLYRRVDSRVGVMMDMGLLSEVRALWENGYLKEDTTAAQAIGYKEIIAHLKGECTLDEAVETIKLSSRRYAKRQLTWFRHEEGVYRLFADRESGEMKDGEELRREAVEAAHAVLKRMKEET